MSRRILRAGGTPLTAVRVTALPRKPVQVIVTQGTLVDVQGDQWIVHEPGGRVTTFHAYLHQKVTALGIARRP